MKNRILLLGIILLSCRNENLSDEQKKLLETTITRHNIVTEDRFAQDSIHELQIHRLKYQQKNAAGFQEYLKAHMIYFSNSWNRPYDIKKDRKLTLQSYLDYCEANNLKPLEYINQINWLWLSTTQLPGSSYHVYIKSGIQSLNQTLMAKLCYNQMVDFCSMNIPVLLILGSSNPWLTLCGDIVPNSYNPQVLQCKGLRLNRKRFEWNDFLNWC